MQLGGHKIVFGIFYRKFVVAKRGEKSFITITFFPQNFYQILNKFTTSFEGRSLHMI